MSLRSSDRGATSVLFATLMLAVISLCAAGLIHRTTGDRVAAEAQTVADLVALSGTTDGSTGSASVASANGAQLSRWADDGGIVAITIRFGGVTASATAVGEQRPT